VADFAAVLLELDREWEHIGQDARGRRAVRRWEREGAPFGSFADPDQLVRWINERGHIEESDALLLELLRFAPFDDLAARTVLQAMMPAAKRLTATFASCGAWCRDETGLVVVGAMWERIRTYPVERRPRKVSANLVLDTRQRVWRTGMKQVHGKVPRGRAA